MSRLTGPQNVRSPVNVPDSATVSDYANAPGAVNVPENLLCRGVNCFVNTEVNSKTRFNKVRPLFAVDRLGFRRGMKPDPASSRVAGW